MFWVLDGKKNDKKKRLVILKTATSTSGQMIFIDTRDAQKKPRKISKTGVFYFDIIEKVQIDRLGRISLPKKTATEPEPLVQIGRIGKVTLAKD